MEQQHADITFEALPQRIDANKFKRRRRGEAATSSGDQPPAATAAAADDKGNCAAAAAAGGGVGAAGFSSGFGLSDIGQQQQQEHEAGLQQQHIEDAQQYRSAAVGEHKFECECSIPRSYLSGLLQCLPEQQCIILRCEHGTAVELTLK